MSPPSPKKCRAPFPPILSLPTKIKVSFSFKSRVLIVCWEGLRIRARGDLGVQEQGVALNGKRVHFGGPDIPLISGSHLVMGWGRVPASVSLMVKMGIHIPNQKVCEGTWVI